jgi:hypothetical protein
MYITKLELKGKAKYLIEWSCSSGEKKQTWEKEQFKKAHPELFEVQPKEPETPPNERRREMEEKKWTYIDVEDTIFNITQQRCIFASFLIALR